ncbi:MULTISPECIES: SLC13 family permease [unclassified Dyella]|uniref:SLC13 family permease n=1 Tax=unclassified Dyella TaxID=2634549 RepID=UPI000C865E37|nr:MULTISPECIES: SLC13 family permease [unclassified Dyella]MDR3444807.1 SLC13 family permease [Dyella sp.]PMQ06128.1 Inner membrane protein YbiR [Dyella sp. AD56]
MHWIKRVAHEHLLIGFGLLAIVLAMVDPQPLVTYQRWLQLPTLAGLLGLMICIQGIRDSGLVQHAAAALVERVHSLRGLGVLLVSATALLSMVLTNDVSLFLLVPLTLAIGTISNLPVMRTVVLEALAVNAGSTLSPIGNPQNLLLWQYTHLPFMEFVQKMLPAFGTMFILLLLLTVAWMPRGRVILHAKDIDGHPVSTPQAILSVLALGSMVLMMEHNHAVLGALLLFVPFALLERGTLRRVDWFLLATFAAIFLGLGHFAELAWVQRGLESLDLEHPLTLYASGILASQLISNVPATVLLLRHAPDPMALAVAVNVGGFGVAIGSLANLIALRLAKQPRGARRLHVVSIPFLLVCAPLVYFVYHWIS